MIEKIAERSTLSIRRHEVALWPRLRFSPTSARARQIEISNENAGPTLLESLKHTGASLT